MAIRSRIAGGSGKPKKHRYPQSCISGIAGIGFIESKNSCFIGLYTQTGMIGRKCRYRNEKPDIDVRKPDIGTEKPDIGAVKPDIAADSLS